MINAVKHIAPKPKWLPYKISVFCLLLLLGSFQTLEAQVNPSKEYEVKAVFLYNFSRFVTWPPKAFSAPGAPFIIGVLGPDPFGSYLDEVVANETILGHPIVIKRYSSIREVKDCQLLYISNALDEATINAYLNELKFKSVLSVSDKDNFCEMGGIINLFIQDREIHFEVNQEAARNAGLIISSKLLSLAVLFKRNS